MPGLLLAAILLAGQMPSPSDGTPAQLTVQVGLFAYAADGVNIGSATTGTDAGSFGAAVFAMPACSFGSGSHLPDQATHAWQVKGNVIERQATETVVRIDWIRARHDGRPTTVRGSRQVVVRKDVPLMLDDMAASPREGCHTARVSLEVRLTTRAVSRGGGTTSHAAGTGTAATTQAGGSQSESPRAPLNPAGRSSPIVERGAPARTSEQAFDVEMWLVHERAEMKDRAMPIRLHVPSAGGTFAFPPLTLATPRGPVTAHVGGTIAFEKNAAGQSVLHVSVTRTLRIAASGEAAHMETGTIGSSEVIQQMPGPEDVVAFRMPPIRSAQTGLDAPDTLSVRLRVRPVE